MDLFMEHIVKHKRTGKDYIKMVGILAAAGILLSASSIMLSIQMIAGLWLFVVAGIIFLTVVLIKKLNLEYEYILTNGELDIDSISSKSARKRVITINFGNIDICAPVTHSQFNNTGSIVKTYDCTGDGEHGVYFVDFPTDKGKVRVLIQPPVSYIENVRRYNPSKIFVN